MTTQTKRAPVTVEHVKCPMCGADNYKVIAEGPDYDHHCCGDQTFKLVRCNQCTFSYLNPRPTVEMLPVIYDVQDYCCYGYTENRPLLAAGVKRYEDARAKLMMEMLPNVAPADFKALDIGTGEGRSLFSFLDLGVPASNLYGNDISDEVLAPIKAKGLQTINSRAEEIDLPDSTFDLIMMNQVIEHVADPRRVMETCYRLLKPGGILSMETPNMDGWDRPFFGKKRWGGYHFPRHWVIFSTDTMTRMLSEIGYEQIDIQNISGAFVWTWNINHTLQDWKFPKNIADLFLTESYFGMLIGGGIDIVPRRFLRSSNMRALGRKKA
jgi:ubiquinone/menaquinone biosynthesis C-methylase UbiE